MNAEDMDDCPVCERETVYDGDRCTVCGRLWGIDYSRADIEARHLHKKAERIADEAARSVGAMPAAGYAAYDAAYRAALAALTEKENAR